MDITELILEDHHRQRRMFALLDDIDRGDTERLGQVWGDIAEFLEVHAAAEEAIFYPRLLRQVEDSADETRDAVKDHNEIRAGIAQAARHPVGTDGWWGGVNAARSANTEHMGEEEDDDLPDFRRSADMDLRNSLGIEFEAAKTAAVAPTLDRDPKDPDDYVEEHRGS